MQSMNTRWGFLRVITSLGLLHGLLGSGLAYFEGIPVGYALIAGLLIGLIEAALWQVALSVPRKYWRATGLFIGSGTGLFFAFVAGFLFALHLQFMGTPMMEFYDPGSNAGLSFLFGYGLFALFIFGIPALLAGIPWGMLLTRWAYWYLENIMDTDMLLETGAQGNQ